MGRPKKQPYIYCDPGKGCFVCPYPDCVATMATPRSESENDMIAFMGDEEEAKRKTHRRKVL